jgi:hypothetical protein
MKNLSLLGMFDPRDEEPKFLEQWKLLFYRHVIRKKVRTVRKGKKDERQ